MSYVLLNVILCSTHVAWVDMEKQARQPLMIRVDEWWVHARDMLQL